MGHTPDERAALVARYASAADAFEAAIADVTEDELGAHPIEGEWSLREIIHHLADGELSSAVRLRRLVAEDGPVLQGYDEAAYARIFRYAERPIVTSLAAARAARASTLEVLRGLTGAEWERTGTHSERGAYSVDTWLDDYANHPHDHADQARRVLDAIRNGAAG
jgi:hypothetical protein